MKRILLTLCVLTAVGTAQAQSPVDKSPHKSAFITRDGVRIHYLDWGGGGKPVLLVHGVNSNAHVFDDFAPFIKDYFRVLGITMRAHGESGTPDSLRVEDIVDDIHALLDSLKIPATHLVAHSLGGAVITRFAVKYPDRVGRLVYLDATPPYGLSAPDMEEWRQNYVATRGSAALENERAADHSVSQAEQDKRHALRMHLITEANATEPDYTHVRTVAFGVRTKKSLKTNYFWLNKADKAATVRAKAMVDSLNVYGEAGKKQFEMGMNERESWEIEASHLAFITEPRKIAFPIRTFLLVRPETDKGH